MEIFKLFGSIFVNTDAADKSMQKTEKNADSIADKLGKGIKTAAKWGTAIVAGAMVAGGAIVAMSTKVAAVGDNIDKMSQKIGISRQAYQELDFICSQSGTSVDSLQMGVKSLTAAMDGAASGTKTNIEQFEKLGVAVLDSNGNLRSQEDVMWETFSALNNLENQTEKARLATELFGRSGTELMPLLNGASGSIEEMKQKAHDLGLVMSDEFVDDSVKFTDTMDQFKRSIKAAGNTIIGAFIPKIQGFVDKLVEFSPKISEFANGISVKLSSAFDTIVPFINSFIENIGNMQISLQPVMDVFSDLKESIVNLFSTISKNSDVTFSISDAFSLVSDVIGMVWSSVLKPVFETLIVTIKYIAENWDSISQGISDCWNMVCEGIKLAWNNLLKPVFNIVVITIKGLFDMFKEHMPAIKEFVGKAFEGIKDTWNNHLKPVFEAIGQYLNEKVKPAFEFVFNVIIKPLIENVFLFIARLWNGTLKPIFDGICDFLVNVFSGNWKKAFQGILNIVTGVFNAIVTVVETPMNTIKDIVNKAIDFIKEKFNFKWELPKLKMPHFNIEGSFSLNPPSVPSFGIDWYAKAMDTPMLMTKPTAFGINEDGQIMAGGEKGSEVVSGTDTLMNMITAAVLAVVSSQNESLINILEKILIAILNMDGNMPDNLKEALREITISLNGREFGRLVKAVQ